MEIIINFSDLLSQLCKAKNKWGLLLSLPEKTEKELKFAAPYLERPEFANVALIGRAFVFGEKAELLELYNQTVGDDGPTPENNYCGTVRIYALVCSPMGEFLYQNIS